MADTPAPELSWQDEWSSRLRPPPRALVVADATTGADAVLRSLHADTAVRWDGDFPTARRVLGTVERRLRRDRDGHGTHPEALAAFRAEREAQSRLTRTSSLFVVRLDADHGLDLPRAPDTREACDRAWGPAGAPSLVPLRELLGALGADQWRRRGVEVPGLAGRIHPHYGVFAPTRRDYLHLVAEAPLPQAPEVAFDVGTGTGVLAALLAGRGARSVVATDVDDRAVTCAAQNLERLGLADRVSVERADLFPSGRADLVVCNPPWLPGRPHSSLERGVYDPGSRTLRAFLDRLARHLRPEGEGWLVLSDLAERIGLRGEGEVEAMIARAGLTVRGRLARAGGTAARADGALARARAEENIVLWRLARA